MTIGKLALVAALGMFAATIADPDRVVWADSTGVIEGLVKDKGGQPLPGVTVVVTSPALQQNQVAITDDQGHYQITALPPGTYVVTFYYAD